jgi:L-amino acid N-acyltransferase YncA
MAITIRPARAADFERIDEIFRAVLATGDTFAWDPSTTTSDEARAVWLPQGPRARGYVAELEGRIAGAYLLKPNQPGLGSHVANAAYMVDPSTRARGLGEAMGRHSLSEAAALGYLAMQFNLVVSTNERAVALWKRLGFSIIGTAPKAFRHAQLGLVDAHIMHRFLD